MSNYRREMIRACVYVFGLSLAGAMCVTFEGIYSAGRWLDVFGGIFLGSALMFVGGAVDLYELEHIRRTEEDAAARRRAYAKGERGKSL